MSCFSQTCNMFVSYSTAMENHQNNQPITENNTLLSQPSQPPSNPRCSAGFGQPPTFTGASTNAAVGGEVGFKPSDLLFSEDGWPTCFVVSFECLLGWKTPLGATWGFWPIPSLTFFSVVVGNLALLVFAVCSVVCLKNLVGSFLGDKCDSCYHWWFLWRLWSIVWSVLLAVQLF